jgi:hypothetical protein
MQLYRTSPLCFTTCSTKETKGESKLVFICYLYFEIRETQVLAIDCERVLTDKGEKLARVSIVNFYGNIVFDTLVKPCRFHSDLTEVIDYREWITGIKPIDLEHAPTFGNIEPIVSRFLFCLIMILDLKNI